MPSAVLLRLACTGKNLENLVTGFLFTSGLIERVEDIEKIDINDDEDRPEARVEIPAPRSLPPETVTSGLGRSYAIQRRELRAVEPDERAIREPGTILRLAAELEEKSGLYHLTRGCYNAALCDLLSVLAIREDIGRHNAIDTLIGECLTKKLDTSRLADPEHRPHCRGNRPEGGPNGLRPVRVHFRCHLSGG